MFVQALNEFTDVSKFHVLEEFSSPLLVDPFNLGDAHQHTIDDRALLGSSSGHFGNLLLLVTDEQFVPSLLAVNFGLETVAAHEDFFVLGRKLLDLKVVQLYFPLETRAAGLNFALNLEGVLGPKRRLANLDQGIEPVTD